MFAGLADVVYRAMDEDMKANVGAATPESPQIAMAVQTSRTRWPETAHGAGVFIVSDDEDSDSDG